MNYPRPQNARISPAQDHRGREAVCESKETENMSKQTAWRPRVIVFPLFPPWSHRLCVRVPSWGLFISRCLLTWVGPSYLRRNHLPTFRGVMVYKTQEVIYTFNIQYTLATLTLCSFYGVNRVTNPLKWDFYAANLFNAHKPTTPLSHFFFFIHTFTICSRLHVHTWSVCRVFFHQNTSAQTGFPQNTTIYNINEGIKETELN